MKKDSHTSTALPAEQVCESVEIGKADPGIARHEVAKAATAWNEMAARAGLPTIKSPLADDRVRGIRARMREHGVEAWYEVIERVEHSAFLTGDTGRGWKATFDWILERKHFRKILEGTYGNGRDTAPASSPKPHLPPNWWRGRDVASLRGLPTKVWAPLIERMGAVWREDIGGPHWSRDDCLIGEAVKAELRLAERFPALGSVV